MTNARNALPVAIAGGGIGGLATALALARHGFRSLVLERAREVREVGVGLQVAPNALSVLDALGIGAAVKKNALMIERLVMMMDAVTGEELANIPCDERHKQRFGNPYAVAHRAHIYEPPLEACRMNELVELRTKARVVDFDVQNSRVSVQLASGERMTAAALIGADGVYCNARFMAKRMEAKTIKDLPFRGDHSADPRSGRTLSVTRRQT